MTSTPALTTGSRRHGAYFAGLRPSGRAAVAASLCLVVASGTQEGALPDWEVFGDCSLDPVDGACVVSPDWPSAYFSSSSCNMTLQEGLGARYLEITEFSTERGFDVLQLPGMNISGDAPHAMSAQGMLIDATLIWSSDVSKNFAGWRICARDAPPPEGAWLAMGPCTVQEAQPDCVQSPNYPEEYGNEQSCALAIYGWPARFIDIIAFHTERGWDELVINGEVLSGGLEAVGAVQGQAFDGSTLVWKSDISGTVDGWVVCARTSPPTSTVTTTTTAALGSWVVEGPCLVDPDDGCLTSPNYPEAYDNDQKCSMYVYGMPLRYVHVVSFSTEKGYDWLNVGGVAYSGTAQDLNGLPFNSTVTWSSDSSNVDSGWKICASESPPTTTTYTTTSGVPGKWVVVGDCEVDPEDDNCVTTLGFGAGENYPADSWCDLSIFADETKYLDVVAFTVDSSDSLAVDDVEYNGDLMGIYQATFGAQITGVLKWRTDGGTSSVAAGWKLCALSQAPSSTTTTSTYGARESWKDLGPHPTHPLPEATDILLP